MNDRDRIDEDTSQELAARLTEEARREEVPSSPALHARIMAAVRAVDASRTTHWSAVFRPALAAAAALLVVVLWTARRNSPGTAPTAATVAALAAAPRETQALASQADALLARALTAELADLATDLQTTSRFLLNCLPGPQG